MFGAGFISKKALMPFALNLRVDPKKTTPVFSSREEELEARVCELELENEILKRLDALAEETKQKRQTR